MENVQCEVNPAVKFKKWIIMAFMTVLLALPMGSAFASQGGVPLPNKDFAYKYTTSISGMSIDVYSDSPFTASGGGWTFTTDIYTVGSNDPTNSTTKYSPGERFPGNTSMSIDSYTGGLVPHPPKPVAEVVKTPLQGVPTAILGNLTTGGLLGLGLAILATMLVVSLVPRLVHLFNR